MVGISLYPGRGRAPIRPHGSCLSLIFDTDSPSWRIQNRLFHNDDAFNVGYRTAYPILTPYPLVNIYKPLLFHTLGIYCPSQAIAWSFLWFPFDFPSARGTNSKKSYFIGSKVRPRQVPSPDLWPSFEFFTFSIGRVKSYHVVRSIWYNKIGLHCANCNENTMNVKKFFFCY